MYKDSKRLIWEDDEEYKEATEAFIAKNCQHGRRSPSQVLKMFLSHSAVLLLAFIFGVVLFPDISLKLITRFSVRKLSIPSFYSPFREGVQYTIISPNPDYLKDSKYVGEPTWEGDRAWNKLITPTVIRLQDDEARKLGIAKGVKITSGGWTITPGYLHNLHCLRRIRQGYYPDYYYPNITKKENEERIEHDMHCLEMLRQSIMCNPDLTSLPHYWSGNPTHNLSVLASSVTRECVNWNNLRHKIVEPRMFPPDEYGEFSAVKD